MKLSYYAETNSLYIELRPGPGVKTHAVADGLNVELDNSGGVIDFDIDHASTRLETVALPVRHSKAA